jgi:hypothetical protein
MVHERWSGRDGSIAAEIGEASGVGDKLPR